jgi:hypothetical protein
MNTEIYQLEDGSFTHKIFENLDADRRGGRRYPIKADTIKLFNEKLMDEDSANLTSIKLTSLAEAAIIETKRNKALERSKIYKANKKELKNEKLAQEGIEYANRIRRAPNFTPGISEYHVKSRSVNKKGEIVEYNVTARKKRKGSKFYRLLEERGESLYNEYKPNGPGTEPAMLTYILAAKHDMTKYMVEKILVAYELKILENDKDSKQTDDEI